MTRIVGGVGWIGPYTGETTGQDVLGGALDSMLAATRNRPTAVVITGEPDSGKTTLAMLLIYQLTPRSRPLW